MPTRPANSSEGMEEAFSPLEHSGGSMEGSGVELKTIRDDFPSAGERGPNVPSHGAPVPHHYNETTFRGELLNNHMLALSSAAAEAEMASRSTPVTSSDRGEATNSSEEPTGSGHNGPNNVDAFPSPASALEFLLGRSYRGGPSNISAPSAILMMRQVISLLQGIHHVVGSIHRDPNLRLFVRMSKGEIDRFILHAQDAAALVRFPEWNDLV